MAITRWFSIRQLILVGLVGLLVGYGAFLLTPQASQTLLPPECRLTADAGFDVLSGLPHGSTIECGQLTGLGGQVPVAQVIPMPDTLTSRRAIPVPLGFIVGSAVMLIAMLIRRARLGHE